MYLDLIIFIYLYWKTTRKYSARFFVVVVVYTIAWPVDSIWWQYFDPRDFKCKKIIFLHQHMLGLHLKSQLFKRIEHKQCEHWRPAECTRSEDNGFVQMHLGRWFNRKSLLLMNHLGRSALCNKQDWGRADNVGDRLWLGAQGVCVGWAALDRTVQRLSLQELKSTMYFYCALHNSNCFKTCWAALISTLFFLLIIFVLFSSANIWKYHSYIKKQNDFRY